MMNVTLLIHRIGLRFLGQGTSLFLCEKG